MIGVQKKIGQHVFLCSLCLSAKTRYHVVSSAPHANVLTVVLPNLLCWIEYQDGRGVNSAPSSSAHKQ